MPGLFRLKLLGLSCDRQLQISFSALKSHVIWNTSSTLPRNGSNFLDSVPHIRQLTSFWRMPPKMAVTTVDAPFLDKPHQRSTVSQKAWAQLPTPVPCLALPPPAARQSRWTRDWVLQAELPTAAAQGHITRVSWLHCFILDLKKGWIGVL